MKSIIFKLFRTFLDIRHSLSHGPIVGNDFLRPFIKPPICRKISIFCEKLHKSNPSNSFLNIF